MLKNRFSARVAQVFAAPCLPIGLLVNAATADQPAEILLYDAIGGWDGITAKDFLSALSSAGSGPVRVRINCPGGDVFDGMAIRNALAAHPGGVTCVVDGIAASAASFIALAGSRLEMCSASTLMIHNAWSVAFGNKNDMRKTADILDKIDGQIVGMYAGKTGGDPADIAAAMDAETWMTPEEAIAAKYCDGICEPPARPKKQAMASASDISRRLALLRLAEAS